MSVKILVGDVRAHLRALPDESVHCMITSPPYWGLRSYGTAPQIWGAADCEHDWGATIPGSSRGGSGTPTDKNNRGEGYGRDAPKGNFCQRCGAWRGDLGLEPTLGMHIEHLVDIFREVHRVLRKDGTVWLNYGDCYATSANGRSAADTKAAGNDDRTFRDKPFSTVGPIYDPEGGSKGGGYRGTNKGNTGGLEPSYVPDGGQVPDSKNPKAYTHTGRVVAGGTLKPKDLCMISNRLAIALQDDNWWVRSEIIWAKANPMPESIIDRPTCAHEKIWLLAKSERYFFDAVAIAEPAVERNSGNLSLKHGRDVGRPGDSDRGVSIPWEGNTRNKRNVWHIVTEPFPEAHFATFPEALVEPCVLAGTSAHGVCTSCGAPWKRTVDKPFVGDNSKKKVLYGEGVVIGSGSRTKTGGHPVSQAQTTGWEPCCKCEDNTPVPATVCDIFGGSGTVGLVADRLGRNAILVELSVDYANMAHRRITGAQRQGDLLRPDFFSDVEISK